MARRMLPSEGASRHVTSICQAFSLASTVRAMADAQNLAISLILRGRRIDFEVAEVAREPNMLRSRDVLVAKEDNFMRQKGSANRRNDVSNIGAGEVNLADLGAYARGQLCDLDRGHDWTANKNGSYGFAPQFRQL